MTVHNWPEFLTDSKDPPWRFEYFNDTLGCWFCDFNFDHKYGSNTIAKSAFWTYGLYNQGLEYLSLWCTAIASKNVMNSNL